MIPYLETRTLKMSYQMTWQMTDLEDSELEDPVEESARHRWYQVCKYPLRSHSGRSYLTLDTLTMYILPTITCIVPPIYSDVVMFNKLHMCIY
jgi:hypothetical protein